MLEQGDGNAEDNMLYKVYDSVYEDNTEENLNSRKFASRAFKWMICAMRPLSIKELTEIVSINDDGAKDEITVEELLSFCSNFIISDFDGTAQFPHLSVREYLRIRKIDEIHVYSPEQAHIQAAVTCLAYLSHPQTHITEFRMSERIVDEYPLLYWIDHLAAVMPQNRSKVLQHLYSEFLSKKHGRSLMLDWLNTISTIDQNLVPYKQYSRLSQAVSEPLNPLFAGCIWGLIDMIPKSSMTTHKLNKLNIWTKSGLILAGLYEHYFVVKLLLEKGADVNAQGGYYGNALHAACCQRNPKIVQLLLEKGANVNAQEECQTALQAACQTGSKIFVRLLLDKQANINAQGGYFGNALQAACCDGNQGIVQLLLDRGANVNTQGGQYGNALQAACIADFKDIVQLLLDRGADVNAQGGYFGNALQAACSTGNRVIVRLLLDNGAGVNAQGGYFGNALQLACRMNYQGIVRLLIDKEADVNAQGGYNENALQAACSTGDRVIVQLLLDRGANIETQGERALREARKRNHQNIINLLLENGVISTEDSFPSDVKEDAKG